MSGEKASGNVTRDLRRIGARLPAPPGLVLLLVCLGQFMVILDVSVVNVALPSIRNDLGFSASGLQWVVNAYALTFAGFLLLGGRAADLFGRRRLLLAGLALFSFASLLDGIADSQTMLVFARALQGFGGAVLTPATLTILIATYPEGRARARALGIWSGVAAAGGASGALLGGVITQYLTWRWVFFINLPIGIAVLIASSLFVAEGAGDPAGRRHIDLRGGVHRHRGPGGRHLGHRAQPGGGLGVAGGPRSLRGRDRPARHLRRGGGAAGPGPAGAAADLLLPLDHRRQPGRLRGGRGPLLGLVLPVAVPPGRPRHEPAGCRPHLHAPDPRHRGGLPGELRDSSRASARVPSWSPDPC